MKNISRKLGRNYNQLRPISITYNAFGYADGSILFELGDTKILCTVSLQQGVPPFLKGTRTGWLTAEYALLPNATLIRSSRDGAAQKYNGRSIEIARLIGRSLRSMINLQALGEQTIMVDCDILQADGGTRTACITAAVLALKQAQKKWMNTKKLHAPLISEDIAAISVGVLDNQLLLDIDYSEDALIDADYNFVLTRSGTIVEIQGTAEKGTVSWDSFHGMCSLAQEGIKQLFAQLDEKCNAGTAAMPSSKEKVPLFSLKNRLNQTRS